MFDLSREPEITGSCEKARCQGGITPVLTPTQTSRPLSQLQLLLFLISETESVIQRELFVIQSLEFSRLFLLSLSLTTFLSLTI